MAEFISYGSRSAPDSSLGTGSAQLTPEQARIVHEHMIRSLGNRRCTHAGGTISPLEGGGYELDCPDCDLRATADDQTAVRLGWIEAQNG